MFDGVMGGIFGLSFVFTVVPALILMLAIPYAMLRLRETRGRPDPQLGFKVAMNFFFSLAIIIVLTGLSIFVIDLIMDLDFGPQFGGRLGPRPFPTDAQRTAFAFVLAGLIFILIHFVCIITLTTDPFRSPARRTFLGWRFAIHGVVVLFALLMLFIVLFQRRERGNDEMRKMMIGILIVWVPSWFLHFVLFRVGSPTWKPVERDWRPPDEEWEPPRRPIVRDEP